METLTIALVAIVKAAIMEGYQRVTGKEMFPANPKGPLYKWFGDKKRD